MADFETEQETRPKSFAKKVELAAGEKLTSDADIVAWANRTVPAGKKAILFVRINVVSLEDV